MFSSVCLGTDDVARSMAFYDTVFAPLGAQCRRTPGCAACGRNPDGHKLAAVCRGLTEEPTP